MRASARPGDAGHFAQQAIWHTNPDATTDQHKFTVIASKAGKTTLSATDRAGTTKASLEVVVGKLDVHPGMQVDLIADVCRGSDPFDNSGLCGRCCTINFLAGPTQPIPGYSSDKENIFSQQAAPNISSDPKVKTIACRKS